MSSSATIGLSSTAFALSALHLISTFAKCPEQSLFGGKVVDTLPFGMNRVGAVEKIGKVGDTAAQKAAALGEWAIKKAPFNLKNSYFTRSTITLIAIFICTVLANGFAQQRMEAQRKSNTDVTIKQPNKWADAFYTSTLSILAVLVAVSISAAGQGEGTMPDCGHKTYFFYKLWLLILLTVFTGLAMGNAINS